MFTTCVPTIDQSLDFTVPTLSVLFGYNGCGKTEYTIQIIKQELMQGSNVIFITLDGDECIKNKFSRIIDDLSSYNNTLHIYAVESFVPSSLDSLNSIIQNLIKENSKNIVVVDNIKLLHRLYYSKHAEENQDSLYLFFLALHRQYHCDILLIYNCNKSSFLCARNHLQEGMYCLSDIPESLEKITDCVFSLYNKSPQTVLHDIRLMALKNRFGAVSQSPIEFSIK